MSIIERLEEGTGKKIDPEHTELKTLGLNHLSWHRGFTVEGEDVWPEVIQGFIEELKKEEHPEWDPRTIEVLRMMPNYYLQYFYHTDKKLKSQCITPSLLSAGSPGMPYDAGHDSGFKACTVSDTRPFASVSVTTLLVNRCTIAGVTGLPAAGVGCAIITSAGEIWKPEQVALLTLEDVELKIDLELVWNRDNASPTLSNFISAVKRSAI